MEESLREVDTKVRDIYEYQVDLSYALEKLAELEDRSSRDNLCIDGINEEKGETWEMCETKVKNSFQEKLEIREGIIIERAHRTNTADKKQPRKIVVKLADYKDKSMIFRKVYKPKGSDIFINEIFSKQTTDLRKELWKEVKQLRSEGKTVCLNYCTVVTKKRNNKR